MAVTNQDTTRNVYNKSYEVRPDLVSDDDILANFKEVGRIFFDETDGFNKYWDGSSFISLAGDNTNGWAQYKDDQYTSGSPLVINSGSTTTIDNNSATSITSQLPIGVDSFYDNATSRITPENSGDAYLLRVDFSAFTSSPSGLAKVKIDIGDGITPNVILERSFTFPKGTGLSNATNYSTTTSIYSLGTFLANGGLVQVESVTGNTSVYDINFVITRVHKAT